MNILNPEAVQIIESQLKKGKKIQLEYNKKLDEVKIIKMELHKIRGMNNEKK